MKFFRQFSFIIIFAGLLIGLSSCNPPLPNPNYSIYRPLSPYQRSLISRMASAGIRVIKQGDVLKVIIPTDTFFKLQTTQLREDKIKAVEVMARFVDSYASLYAHPTILVDGYSDTVFSPSVQLDLSKEYATVIASYLWNEGIPQSRIRIRGLGSANPVASNRYPAGTAFNRRVEIVVYF